MPGLSRFNILFLLAAPLSQSPQQQPDPHPRAVVRQALRAVEAGSAGNTEKHWLSEAAHGSRVARLGLAATYRLTYRYDSAEREYGALETTTGARPDLIDAYARLDHGLALATRGEIAAAGREFAGAREAARIAGDRSVEAEALIAIAVQRRHSSGNTVGLATIDTALGLVDPSDTELRGRALCARADFLASRSAPDADSVAISAMQLATTAHDPRTVAACLRAREIVVQSNGATTANGGPLDSAIVLLEHIAERQERVHDRAGFALTLTRLAALQIGDSHLGAARSSLRRSLAEASVSGDRASTATDNYLLGIVSMRLGDTRSAATYLHGAVATFDSLGDENGAMVVRSNLPDLAVVTGDTIAAMRDARLAFPYFQRHGDASIVIAMRRSVAAIERRAHHWSSAQAQLDSARAEAAEHRLSELTRELVSDYGRLALDRGDLAGAERIWTRALRTFTRSEQLDRYEALARLADVHARMGQLDRAEREITLAGERLDRWRATLSERELQVFAFQATNDGVSDPGNSVANVIAALASHGHIATALTLADRRRARSVTDALLRTSAQTVGGAELDAPATGALDQIIRSALPDSTTALIEYSAPSHSSPITLFAVTTSGARAYVLPSPDSIASLSQRLTVLIDAGAAATDPSRKLGALLLDSAVAGFPPGIRRVIIIADGNLHRIPFDVLRLHDGKMVLQHFATSSAPSAAALLALWQRPASTRPMRLLAFGDPIFDRAASTPIGAVSAEDFRSTLSPGGSLPRLPASSLEARSVARFAPAADVRLRDSASAAFLKHAPLDRYRIIHFATHALVDEHDNAATALALSPSAGESGFVSPSELAQLHLDADMVVLSACRSARGVLIGGEGVQGLTTPLLEAGARSVVASRWKVDDQRTETFMADFYTELARGLPVSDALRATKLIAIERGATPRDWAAFTVVGDPLVRPPLILPPVQQSAIADYPSGAVAALITFVAALGLATFATIRYRSARKRESGDRSVPPDTSVDTHQE
jgi:hypothetical protein